MHRRAFIGTIATTAAGAGLLAGGGRRADAGTTLAATGGRPASPLVTADGTSIFHKDWGTGRPVVFVAGWCLFSDFWEYQMAPLAGRGLRCIGYDRRGHGRSGSAGGGYDFDTLADDLAMVLERLDLRAVTLVGHSTGAAEIVRYLSRHGAGRVARVLLVAPTTPFLLKTADNPDGIDASFFARVRGELMRDRPRWLSQGAAGFFGMPEVEVSAEMRQWGHSLSLQTSPKAALDLHRAMTETDFRADVRNVRLPTLVIHGDRDKSAPLDFTGRRTAGLIPGARLVLYEGAAHGLPITHCERLNADIEAFVGS